MGGRDILSGALRALLAARSQFRERLADALLCLLCADISRSCDDLPADVRDWIAELRSEVLRTQEPGPLSDAVRRWVEGLEGADARAIAHRIVVCQAKVDKVY